MSAKVMLSATRISHIEDNTVLFLSESGINASLIPVCCLYNADDDIEALLYTISGGGYIVVSYKDGHVIEYSLNDLPFDIKDVNPDNRIYYGGPLFFYQKDDANNCFTDLSAYLVNNGWGSNGVYVSASDIGTGSVFRMMWLS